MEIKIKKIETPQDIRGFQNLSSDQLKALIVFRKDGTNMIPPKEAESSLRWLTMALSDKWAKGIIPRHYSHIESDNLDFRKSKMKEILENPLYGQMILVEEDFDQEHYVYEFENVIDGKMYYCFAIFKS